MRAILYRAIVDSVVVDFVAPAFTPSRVKAAGKRIRDGRATADDLLVMENWRASHAYVLNTFQTNLRRRARAGRITVAQRLKRRTTIFDKLRREPTMQLNTMHDIAGCRLIFQNEADLYQFRNSLHEARSNHKLRHAEEDRYNYIEHPKASGYRGIHDVYEYHVNSNSGKAWNGLHVEIQYRTVYQHAWATAVEAADLVTSSRIKFSLADQRYEKFFQICSEIIARGFEGRTSCFPEVENHQLLAEFDNLAQSTGLLSTLRRLKKSTNEGNFKQNTILIFRTSHDGSDSLLEIEAYDSINRAVERYSVLERELGTAADIVLVRAESADSVRDAFRNYFSDTYDFIQYIDQAKSKLAL